MSLTMRLQGKRVAQVMSNGHILSIRCDDGSEFNVAWVDDNGQAIKGRPVVQSRGGRLQAAGLRDLVLHPAALLKG
jgi:hypothetical protein